MPHGTDVQKAKEAREEIENVLKSSNLPFGVGVNVCMMKVKRRKVIVIIRNPQPNMKSVCEAIEDSSGRIVSNKIEIIFKDDSMKEIDRYNFMKH